MSSIDEIRQYWDDDAATYDNSPRHRPRNAAVQAAWNATIERALPPAPAKILDCGAGTGFLSLIAARLGHAVTALDFSEEMLRRLRQSAAEENLDIDVIVGSVTEPPSGFDAVMERNLLWTLPDPLAALRAWRAAAPGGRLVVVGGVTGSADPVEQIRRRGRELVARWQKAAPEHHARYSDEVLAALPIGSATLPSRVAELLIEAGWTLPRLARLRDVEWAETEELSPAQRIFGVPPRFIIVAS